ncbi:bifunctional preprotein translocase subunit SecD/SecF [Bremerella volcania]|uniref:Multifunctional fusion protein n=1 Tax=Bremerella volcania TaxID=2527984 RepID=A0A518C6P2_9BACT|nr:protein translocase subunit SecD [Bremerella volcania]QDU74887.1 bifunctional preprotein translocase subunit SecD/SecF [Bremerella volcania]
MQKSCTIFAVMLVLTLTVTLLTGVDFGLDAGGSSWLGSTAMAQDAPAPEVPVPTVNAAPAETPSPGSSQTFNVLGIILLTIVVPYILGFWLATAIRLPELSRKLGIIFASLVCSITICFLLWPPKFGIDLQGGVILVYEVDEQASLDLLASDTSENAAFDMTPEKQLEQGTAQLITQLQKRINPSGVSEVVIRPYGENQVEVIVPQAESADLDSIKRLITKAGVLDFMIVANKQDHDYLITRAEDEGQIGVTFVTDREGNRIGRWVRVDDDARGAVGEPNFANPNLTPYLNSQRHLVRGGGPGVPFEVLMRVERPEARLGGKHLSSSAVTRDEYGKPAVSFEFGVDGANRMGRLSQENLSEPNIPRKLGIVMDNFLISAPRINAMITDRGIITGDFTQQEVTDLVQVLRSGKLPVVLRKEPISEQKISATLGDDTIRKGQVAITVSLIAVLVFMAIYYRVAGLVACFALVFNLVLILAVMIAIKADLTLPGIAGLVLTVGMAVDANVLIYERIREEINGGATLRVALSNGFGKAMSTIVDANITTLITAAVLYRIGTDQVRGFAVTLFVGILMSMFTAIYVSRGIFDILEKKRILSTLKFMPSASSIGYDFIGKQKMAGMISLVVILVGMIGVGVRGKDIFDIDFNGGSSVQVFLEEPMPISEVRSKLTGVLPDLSVSAVTMEGYEDRIYKVDTSMAEYGQLGKVVITDRTGASAEVDLAGVETLSGIIERLAAAEVGVAVLQNTDGDGIEFQDETGADSGAMSVKNVDDKTQTADHLRMNFSTDALRYNTGAIPAGVEVVQDRISQVFTGPNGESLLVMHNMDFTPPATAAGAQGTPPVKVEAPETTPTTTEPMETAPEPEATEDKEDAPAETPEEKPETPEGDMQSLIAPVSSRLFAMLPWHVSLDVLLQDNGEEEVPATEKPAEEAPADEKPAEEEKPADAPAAEEKPMEEAPMADKPAEEPAAPMTEAPVADAPMPESPTEEAPATGPLGPLTSGAETPRFKTQTEMSFDEGISAETVRTLVNDAADSLRVARPEVALLDNEGKTLPVDSRVSQTTWTVKLSSAPDESAKILEQVSKKLDSTPVWPSSSKIGSKVAGDMQTMAILAIGFCLIGIVGYIWFRFQSVAFGVAAVVALVHDVLVTLGFIALSVWLAPVFGFLQVTEFKISLPVVAAFLTIIGYSLNDTIVIFDRIREVRGKSPDLTSEMVNISINQTLGRTLLTSLTTLIVVLILYFIGGEGIHSFSFSLVVGVIAGTYSTIFIACPVLIWLMNRDKGSKKVQA